MDGCATMLHLGIEYADFHMLYVMTGIDLFTFRRLIECGKIDGDETSVNMASFNSWLNVVCERARMNRFRLRS